MQAQRAIDEGGVPGWCPVRSALRGRGVLLVFGLALACARAERLAPDPQREADTPRGALASASSAPVRPPPRAGGIDVRRIDGLILDGAAQEGVVVRVDLARAALEPIPVPGQRLTHLGADPTLVVAVNAGYFEADGTPSGLLAGPSVEYGVARPRGGSGVALVRARRAALLPYTSALEVGDPIELAVQAGPRLLEPDGRVGIRSDDGQRAPRTAL